MANMGRGGHSRVLEWLPDAHAPLHGHGATQEERSQAKEDHAGTEKFAENLRGFACLPACYSLPLDSSEMEVQSECAGDQMSCQVAHKKSGCEQQKWRLRSVVEAGVGCGDDGQAD